MVVVINFLLSLLPVSLGIWAIHILFEEDQLLEKAGDWMEEHWPVWLNKPLWGCPICMSSIWGTIGFFSIEFFFGVDHPMKLYFPFIFCQCGLNVILNGIVNKKRVIKELDTEAFRQLHDLTKKHEAKSNKAA